MLKDGKPRNHEGDLAARQLAHEFVAMIVGAIQNREVTPTPASFMNSLEFAAHPAGFILRRSQLDDANLLAFRLVGAENFLGKVRADRVLADDLGGDTQNIRSGAVIFSKADAEPSGVLTFAPACKAFQEQLKAAERSAAKAIDGLIVVAYGENVLGIIDQQLQQAQLGDVGVLKFVNENVTKAILQRGAEGGVALQQTDCSGDQSSEGRALLFAQQLFAGTVGASNLLFAGHGFFALRERIGVELGALGLKLCGELVDVSLIIITGNQFILATREKLHEIVQELPGLGQTTVAIELQPRKIAPQQNPMIELVQHAALRVGIFQEPIAESVKCFQCDIFRALADRFHDARFHLSGGFVGEGQAQNALAWQVRIGEQ